MMDAIKFGTSGLRGPASELLAQAPAYVRAFLVHLARSGMPTAGRLCIGRDLRASSPQILRAVCDAATEAGLQVLDCGALATPALAHFALGMRAPAIMVSGSHIPADRNGLKFFTARGEITKADEAGILAALGAAPAPAVGFSRDAAAEAARAYSARHERVLPPDALRGLRVGVFEHSAVIRDVLCERLTALGAAVHRFDRSDIFVPVDTEAPDDAVFLPIPLWVRTHGLDALVSTDGDSDRPLLADAEGRIVRGDALGALAARALGATVVATPVTANSGLEAALAPATLLRTRVGSPFVIAAMEKARADGEVVVGFEANGGLLLGSDVQRLGLTALPTRDALLPLLLVLGAASTRGITIADLVAELRLLPARAGRIADVPPAVSAQLMADLADARSRTALIGDIASVDATDGLRFSLPDGATIHFRASGNAPELRCYTEAPTDAVAESLLARGLAVITAAKSAAL